MNNGQDIRHGADPVKAGMDYQYQGPDDRAAYFEGWYLKFALDRDTTLSLIPSLHKNGQEVHGYLQWIIVKGQTLITDSVRFPLSQIALRRSPFSLRLGANLFTPTRVMIREKNLEFQADFRDLRLFEKDIMGPFRSLHRHMPCNHGLLVTSGQADVTLRSHEVSGTFASRVYAEKDWGDTFPERYIWIHADFPELDSSFFFSIARVKVGFVAFPGFIANLVLDGTDHTFATWNLAQCKVTGNAQDIRVSLANKDIRLTLRISPQESVHLKSPVEGLMDSTIRESLSAPLRMVVEDDRGNIMRLSTINASVEHHAWFDEEEDP